MITVTLPFLTLANDPASDPRLSGLDGWYDGTTSKNPQEERPQALGAWDPGSPKLSGADYVVSGEMSIRDAVAMFSTRDDVMSVQGIAELFPIQVEDPLGTRTAMVRLQPGGRPAFRIDDESGIAGFSIPLFAPDPRKYAPVVSVSNGLPTSGTGMAFPMVFPADFGSPGNNGRVVTSNPGKAETTSLLEVTGGFDVGFSLICVELGRELRVNRPIPVGSTVFLNQRTGAVYIDAPGNDISGTLTKREWWSIPAGGTRTIQFTSLGATTGTPTLTARTAPGYW